MKKVLIMVNLIVIVVALLIILISGTLPKVIVTKNMTLLESVDGVGSYELLEENKLSCDLVTFSWIVSSMVKDGYAIESKSTTERSIDVTVGKDDLKVRMFYKIDGEMTSICNQYEKSYIPISYINGNRDFGGDIYGIKD